MKNAVRWLLSGCMAVAGGAAPEVLDLGVPDGFVAEEMGSVDPASYGSWVRLAVDPKGRLIVAPQQRNSLLRVTVPGPGESGEVAVEVLTRGFGQAQGLCFVGDDLWVTVNGSDHRSPGVYRLAYRPDMDRFNRPELLLPLNSTTSEHGPHALVVSPDGKQVYLLAGNYTPLPEKRAGALLPPVAHRGRWGADLPSPSSGGARARGGFVLQTDLSGSTWTLVAAGLRNPYDLAFHRDGGLYTVDSDTEVDAGLPWYRPTRLVEVLPGGDYGWRSGNGKWPFWFPDTPPTVCDTGAGSPAGMASGSGLGFPAPYADALFVCDWTYGRLMALHLREGSDGVSATRETFLQGKPLPVTDVVAHPGHQCLYLVTGGRGVPSRLIRLRAAEPVATQPLRASEQREEQVVWDQRIREGGEGVAWELLCDGLGSEDARIRQRARTVLYQQTPTRWQHAWMQEKNNAVWLEAGLVYFAGHPAGPAHLKRLAAMNPTEASPEELLTLLRCVEWVGLQTPDAARGSVDGLRARLEGMYPAGEAPVTRALAVALAVLQSEALVPMTVPLLERPVSRAAVDREVAGADWRDDLTYKALQETVADPLQIALAEILSQVDTGWDDGLRVRYFQWYRRASEFRGGMAFGKYLGRLRRQALMAAPEEQRKALYAISNAKEAVPDTGEWTIEGPGRDWTVSAAMAAVGARKQPDLERGGKLLASAHCLVCHGWKGRGGGHAPVLDGVANRYSLEEVVRSVVTPSASIPDVWQWTEWTLKDGRVILGKKQAETGGVVTVQTSRWDPASVVAIPVDQVVRSAPSGISPMPKGLVNGLNPEELADLVHALMTE